MKADITNIIDVLQSGDFYGAGEYVEQAKGLHEYTDNYKGFKRKIKRLWRSRK